MRKGNSRVSRLNQIEDKVAEVIAVLDEICYQSNIEPSYSIEVSDTYTYVEDKHAIHLVVWNQEKNCLYDDQTIIYAAIHELTHILCPGRDHSPLFNSMEEHFQDLAADLSIFDPEKDPDPTYPCIEEEDH
jgi:hypothetical protein